MKEEAYDCLDYMGKILNAFSELGRKTNRYEELGGNDTVNKLLARLGDGQSPGQRQMYYNQLAYFEKRIEKANRSINADNEIKSWENKYGRMGYLSRINPKRLTYLENEKAAYWKEYGKGGGSYMTIDEIKADKAAVQDILRDYKIRGALRIADKPKFGGGGGGGHTGGGHTGGGHTYHSPKKVEYPVGSIGYYEDEISKLQQELKFQTNSDEIAKIKREIKDLQNQIDSLENPNQHLDVELEDYRKQYEPKNILPTQEELDKLKIPNPFEEWQNAQSDIDKILEGVDMGLIGREKGKELIDGINSQLENQGLKPIKTKVDENDALQETGRIVDIFGDAFSTMGESLKMPELNVVGVIAQSIANIIYGFSEAMKNPVNGVGGVFTWIAASVAGLAQLTAMISQIKSIGSYANGGIIGGNSFAGDNLIARVNSGEMILNTNHQRNLFDMLKYGTANGVNNNTVKFVIQGKDLFGVLSNYNNRTSKIR